MRGGEAQPAGRSHAAPDVAGLCARLTALLRDAGVPAGPADAARFASALLAVRPSTLAGLYWTARVTLVHEAGHLDAFERVFGIVFGGSHDPAAWRGQARTPPRAPHRGPAGRRPEPAPGPRPPGSAPGAAPPLVQGSGRHPAADGPRAVLAFASDLARTGRGDFAAMSPDELETLRRLSARLADAVPVRPARRSAAARRGPQLDMRSTLARARRSGGDPVPLERRRRRPRPRRLVVLCDISGSMAPYARAYVQLLWSAVGAGRAEVFVFATSLTRLTRALSHTDPSVAVDRAAAAAEDWSGGTRIGAALKAFNDGYGRAGMARGALVLILSDGWEGQDPGSVAREMDRLHRLAHRVVWANPRAAAEGFEPLAGGMRAALPYVDTLVSGHAIDALDELLAALSPARRHDPGPRRRFRAKGADAGDPRAADPRAAGRRADGAGR